MTKLYFLLLNFFLPLTNGQHLATAPMPCTPSNKGHCECGDETFGFHTYIFYVDDQQRCFTVYHPNDRASEILPVFFSSNCYANDQLQGIDMVNPNSPNNHAAARYGYARIGLSSPTGSWHGMGNDGIGIKTIWHTTLAHTKNIQFQIDCYSDHHSLCFSF